MDNHLKREAFKHIKKTPQTYLLLCCKKLVQFWGRIPGEIKVLEGLPLIKIIIYIFHYSLIGLFFLGLIIIIIKHSFQTLFIIPLSMIVYFTGIHAALVALPRYRIPIIPMVIIFSAYGLSEIIRWLRRDKASNTSVAL